MLKLSAAQRSLLRSQAHSLNPVVMIGEAGLSDAVLKEINVNLNAHGLIKIRILGDDRLARIDMLQTICQQLNAAPIQHIGKLLVIYRPKKESDKSTKHNKKGGFKSAITFKPGLNTIKNRVKKVLIKDNERVTQGGLIKRKKTRQISSKKKALSQ